MVNSFLWLRRAASSVLLSLGNNLFFYSKLKSDIQEVFDDYFRCTKAKGYSSW